VKSFPKTSRTQSEAFQFGRSHNYKTKQTTFLHRQTNVTYAIGPSVTMFSTDFSFQNLIFWNLFEFSALVQTHETKPIYPYLSRAFQRDQECNLKHPNSVDLITTKQTNYVAS
jgi:hypothetical protein